MTRNTLVGLTSSALGVAGRATDAADARIAQLDRRVPHVEIHGAQGPRWDKSVHWISRLIIAAGIGAMSAIFAHMAIHELDEVKDLVSPVLRLVGGFLPEALGRKVQARIAFIPVLGLPAGLLAVATYQLLTRLFATPSQGERLPQLIVGGYPRSFLFWATTLCLVCGFAWSAAYVTNSPLLPLWDRLTGRWSDRIAGCLWSTLGGRSWFPGLAYFWLPRVPMFVTSCVGGAAICVLFRRPRTPVIALFSLAYFAAVLFHHRFGTTCRYVSPPILVDLAVLATLLAIPYLGATLMRFALQPRPTDWPLCPHCDYNLTSNVSGVCPECGTAVEGAARDARHAYTQ